MDRLEELKTPMQSDIPCCRCGGVVVEFSVPNDSWNTLIRRGGKEHDQEYLCLDCFSYCAAETVERLQAIVDNLPRTADGVPVVPGQEMEVYHPTEAGSQDDVCWVAWWWVADRDGGSIVQWHEIGDCYSTPEAAEAAR